MKAKRSIYEIRYALQPEIAGALNEISTILNVEIHEINKEEETYSIKGTFKVTPLFSTMVKRKGKFEAKLDEDLRIISLKITEEEL